MYPAFSLSYKTPKVLPTILTNAFFRPISSPSKFSRYRFAVRRLLVKVSAQKKTRFQVKSRVSRSEGYLRSRFTVQLRCFCSGESFLFSFYLFSPFSFVCHLFFYLIYFLFPQDAWLLVNNGAFLATIIPLVKF